MTTQLSEAEHNAIDILKGAGGSMLVSKIPEKNERNVFGGIDPGMAVYKKLAKKGLVYFTEEDPVELEDGSMFEFTPSVYLED